MAQHVGTAIAVAIVNRADEMMVVDTDEPQARVPRPGRRLPSNSFTSLTDRGAADRRAR